MLIEIFQLQNQLNASWSYVISMHVGFEQNTMETAVYCESPTDQILTRKLDV